MEISPISRKEETEKQKDVQCVINHNIISIFWVLSCENSVKIREKTVKKYPQ